MPVWAPNPGVPPVARGLAYVFGALLALTVSLSIIIERPPDLPVVPARWVMYTAPDGLMLQYPAGWRVRTEAQGQSRTILFTQLPNSPVMVQALMITLSHDIDAAARAFIVKEVENSLRKDYPNYTPTAVEGDLHRFTCTARDSNPLRLAGGWTLQIHGHRVVVLLALTPAPGWSTMEPILAVMQKNLTFSSNPHIQP
ncbi:MAG: hypothetical protein BWY76_00729 [bacterium ADurb.Bin429]|nr:MAG: hypothetical protein BWY76_00729 [bacterium ADurb.Bin429]